MHRCSWVPKDDKLYQEYHDFEWGVPIYQDQKLFEFSMDGQPDAIGHFTCFTQPVYFMSRNLNVISFV